MSVPVQAIETEYHGYRMRSRLEARYAVMFDALGLEWEYEREGFRLKSGHYLPDFWLATVNMWAEVKAVAFSKTEKALAQELANMTGYPVLMLVATPDYKSYPACMPDNGQQIDFYLYDRKGRGMLWANYGEDDPCSDVLRDAVETARGARFEHGERGERV